MLDWRKIVEESEAFVGAQTARGMATEDAQKILSEISAIAKERSESITQVDALKAERNQSAQQVGQLMKQGQKEEAQALIAKGKDLGAEIEKLEGAAKELEAKFTAVLEVLPNYPDASAPIGKDESDNKEIHKWGELPEFDFEPKTHDVLGEELGLLDFKRASKLSGARFTFLRGALAQLERALASFMMDLHRPKGYEEMITPYLVSGETMYGMGQLPKFEEDLFKVVGEGQATSKYLIPTAEVPLTSYFADEILAESELPTKFMAFSPCFRSEAGSYGRDTKGYIRQHQFNKVELVKFAHPERSFEELDLMLADAEEVLKQLRLPFRTVQLCTGDMGFSSTKTYDIEVWMAGSTLDPEAQSKGVYREISSCSNCGDFQARRAKIRFRPEGSKKTEFVHTLNGSGLAVGRTLVAVLENYQQADGSIKVPEVLVPYMGGLKVIEKLRS